jgi:hypothetical protein
VSLAQLTGEPANVARVLQPRSRSGIGGTLEQQITPDLGIFARAGLANGNVQDYEITDIDRTFTVGLSQSGIVVSDAKRNDLQRGSEKVVSSHALDNEKSTICCSAI